MYFIVLISTFFVNIKVSLARVSELIFLKSIFQ